MMVLIAACRVFSSPVIEAMPALLNALTVSTTRSVRAWAVFMSAVIWSLSQPP